MGTIVKRGKTYHATWYENGKKRWQSLKTSRLSEAKLKLNLIELKVSKGEEVLNNKKILIDDCLSKYLNSLEARSTLQHFKEERNRIKRFVDYSSIYYLAQINSIIFEQYLAYRKKQNRSPATIWHDFNAVRAFLNWCVKNNFLSSHPLKNIKVGKREKKPPRFLTQQEVRALLETAKGNIMEHMIYIALYTGVRAGEIQRMEWKDWDFNNNTLTIPKAKSKRFRVVPFNPELKEIISPIIRDEGKCFDYAKIPPRKQFSKIKNQLHFDHFDFHSLRHTYITNLILAGVPIPIVKELAGHANIETTMIYVHLLGIHKEDAAKKVSYKF